MTTKSTFETTFSQAQMTTKSKAHSTAHEEEEVANPSEGEGVLSL